MSKKITVFFVLIWTMISCNAEDMTHVYPQVREETFVTFKIPYPQRDSQKKYFQEDVDYILLVESLEIDGVPVQVKSDNKCYLSLVREYKCKDVKKNENLYVDMKWDIVGQNYEYNYRGEVFYIPTTVKEVKLNYRVVYPFPFGNAEKLLQQKYSDKYVSKPCSVYLCF